MGIPIFPIEDMYSGTALTQTVPVQMGVGATAAYDANIMISPDQGTTDEDGSLVEELARYAVKAQVRAIEIISKYAGLLEK